MLHIEVLTEWQWPLPEFILEWAFLLSGLVIAIHYLPLMRSAWLHPEATALAQPLSTWTVWTVCRLIGFGYSLFALHDLLLLIVVGADLAGRFAMALLIVRARRLVRQQSAITRERPTLFEVSITGRGVRAQ